jgi:T5SS/PEP-CTERM-associated repeat protein
MKAKPAVLGCLAMGWGFCAHAQFTANFQTNTISGVASNWVNAAGYVVGSNTFLDALRIINGGVLSNGPGYIGYETGGSNNVAIISGTGSVWSNGVYLYVGYSGAGNKLVVSNGGAVFNVLGNLGLNSSSSNNLAVVTGSGSVWSNGFYLYVGNSGAGNKLVVSNGGVVFNGLGFFGADTSSSNNAVVVTGTGSVLSNQFHLYIGLSGAGNQLVVSDGGAVFNDLGNLGLNSSSSNNMALVTGTGSVWSSRSDLFVGYSGACNALTISNGGALFNNYSYVGYNSSSSNNSVLVTGAGSIWSNGIQLSIGSLGAGNALTISNGGAVVNSFGIVGAFSGFSNSSRNNSVRVVENGQWRNNLWLIIGDNGNSNVLSIAGGSVLASNAFIGYSAPSFGIASNNVGIASNNVIRVDSGSLFVTNALGDGALVVSQSGGKGSLILNGGSVAVDSLIATNDLNSVVTINGGMLNTKATFVTNAQQFVVGDGAAVGTFHLLGGVHNFNNGLRIRNASFLTGCGTINGTVVVDPGGSVVADCGGLLTFNGSVTNNGTMRAINGSVLESYGPVINNGTIDILNGGTNFHAAFINYGTVLDAGSVKISQVSKSGQDFIVQIPSITGHTYQLQFTKSLSPPNWMNTGASQSGTGGILTFSDFGGATNSPARFYRVVVTAP